MMSLYDVTEAVTVITVPKGRRNGARYWLTACVCVCVGRWSSSRLTLCLKLLPQSLECWIGTCLYQETLGKIYSFEDNNIFKLAQLNRKETERQEGVHGYLSWWLGTSLWPCDKTKIASDWASRGESKTHQMLAGTTQGGILIILC